MRIPSRKECYGILIDAEMPEHIAAHSIQVCSVAELLAGRLGLKGFALDTALVRASALLHDITKQRSLHTHEDHAVTGAELVRRLGYPEVAEIVRQHVRLDEYFEAEDPSEAEVVNYADKRVLHDKVVSLEERMDYILRRYAKTAEHRGRILRFRDMTRMLEKRIFGFLAITPEDVEGLLAQDERERELEIFRGMLR